MKFKKENKFLAFFKAHPLFTKILKNTGIMLLIIACVIPLQYALGTMKVNDENIFLVFALAVIIILIQTKNIIYGIVSSFFFVLSFNFLNAEPLFTLDIDDPNYYISFIIFIVVSLIVGTLVVDLQRQNRNAIESSQKVNAMYDLSSKLLDNHDRPFIYNYVVDFFQHNLKYKFFVIDTNNVVYGDATLTDYLKDMKQFCLEKNIVIGRNTLSYNDSKYLAFPIRTKENYYGALFVSLLEKDMPKQEVEFIQQNIFHLVVALDREYAVKEQQTAKVNMEKERLKTALLRSLSHDLKTPLTSIKSGSDLILNSYDKIDDKTKKEIINDIYQESCDLNEFIVNLLNMTKLNQDKSLVKRKTEPVDEIISDLKSKLSRTLGNKTLEIVDSKEVICVYADAVMIEQVLGNLVSNAIKHTKDNTHIRLEYYETLGGVTFNVIDNGGGIQEKDLDKIFEDFYTLALKQDHHRGTGLGLSICKAIVEAHGGTIKAYNNDIGGATFTFTIPNKEGDTSNGK